MRRAQSTQVYVVVGVIFFFGIVLGFKLIYDFLETSSDIKMMEFQTRLKADVETMGRKPGSVQSFSYVVPYRTDKVCFYDKSAATGALPNNPLVKSLAEEGKNIFLLTGLKPRGIKVDRFSVPSVYECMNMTRNTLRLSLQGTATSVMIRPATT